ncbi:MAG: hypothetical protein WCG63_00905 [Opitutaceae bacterium]
MKQMIMHGRFPTIARSNFGKLGAQRMRSESAERDPAKTQKASYH